MRPVTERDPAPTNRSSEFRQTVNSHDNSTESPKPFRFLDLPKEIRLMVYENCTIQRKHYHLSTTYTLPNSPTAHATLVVSALPAIKLLRTCSTIRNEALPIFDRNQLPRLAKEPIRLIIGRARCSIYTSYLKDIVLLMLGLRTDSIMAPQYPGLGQWLYAHAWGHRIPKSKYPHVKLAALVVSVEFNGPFNFVSEHAIDRFNTQVSRPRSTVDEHLNLALCPKPPGKLLVKLCAQALDGSGAFWFSTELGLQELMAARFWRKCVMDIEGVGVVKWEDWKRDWVEKELW